MRGWDLGLEQTALKQQCDGVEQWARVQTAPASHWLQELGQGIAHLPGSRILHRTIPQPKSI